ncbi:WD40 repeat domain-containing protein [Streptomyces canus]|uniref:WD40 repeat domain-containing protein n=1 Tax=Streptomyces canus TaxID=58343 RepID=UPI002782DC36|nr:glucose/arabinose dehydrogenase [Streptomyces canus]
MASGATIPTAATSATARNPALASAPTARVPSGTGKLPVTALTTGTLRSTPENPSSARRHGHRRAKPAIKGAPTAIPTAKPDTSNSRAMSRISPGSMNSDVPCANTATPRHSDTARGTGRTGSDDGQSSDGQHGGTALAFSRDGRTLAVAGSAGSPHLGDLASQRLLGTTLPTPGAEIRALAFGPDGTLYASGTHIPVRRYDLNPGHLITEVCRCAGSGLSGTAWKTYLPDLPYRRTC